MFNVVCIDRSLNGFEIGSVYRCYDVTYQIGRDENNNAVMYPSLLLAFPDSGTIGWAAVRADAFIPEEYAKDKSEWPETKKVDVWKNVHVCNRCGHESSFIFHKVEGLTCPRCNEGTMSCERTERLK